MSKAYNTGDYNLFCSGNKVVKNRDGWDKVFGQRTPMWCRSCHTMWADRYHFRDGVYYCTYCAKRNGRTVEERHIP
jgi:hypothetical protein|tara:strand:- start:4626 stop:4853 length:228 start_codon:yes stop_codon:yes gene_type:complete